MGNYPIIVHMREQSVAGLLPPLQRLVEEASKVSSLSLSYAWLHVTRHCAIPLLSMAARAVLAN